MARRGGRAARKKSMGARTLLIRTVHVLATGPNDIRYRLVNAFQYIEKIRREDLPTWLRTDFESLLKAFSWIVPGEYPSESVRKITKSTGVKIAKRVLYVSERLREIYETDL